MGDNQEDLLGRSLYGDEDDFVAREFEFDIDALDLVDEGELLACDAPGQAQQQRRSWSELFLQKFESNERDFYSSIDELD